MNHGGTEAWSRSVSALDDLYEQLHQLTRIESMRLGPPTITIIGDKIEIVPQQPSHQFQECRDYILKLIAKHSSIPGQFVPLNDGGQL